jgi:hypothetical protein
MSSTSACTVQQVGLTGTQGCFAVLTRTTFFWGKYVILFELGLCALSVRKILFDLF